MDEREVFYSKEAESDIINIFYELKSRTPGLEYPFLKKIQELADEIDRNFEQFDTIQGNIRYTTLAVESTLFTAVFEVFPAAILIMKVFEKKE